MVLQDELCRPKTKLKLFMQGIYEHVTVSMGVLNISCLFVCHSTVVIILDLEVIKPADQVAGKIGDPTPYVEGEYTLHWGNQDSCLAGFIS